MFNQKASLYSDPNSERQYSSCENEERSYQEGGYSDVDPADNLGANKKDEGNKECSSLLPNAKSTPNIQTTSGPTISKEERTLISMGESSSSSKSSPKSKTDDDDFWVLLNDHPSDKNSKN